MRLLKTLRSQFVAVVAAAVIVSNLAVLVTMEIAREGDARGVRMTAMVERVSALFELVSQSGAPQREDLLTLANYRFFRATIDAFPGVSTAMMSDEEKEWANAVQSAESSSVKRQIFVHLSETQNALGDRGDRNGRNDDDQRRTLVEITQSLGDGSWLTVRFDRPQVPPLSWELIIGAALATLLTCGAAAWLSQRVSRPISELAAASDHVARGANAPHLEPKGPQDLRRAAEAFNAMSERVTRTLENQRQLLSAVGHDLRTPIAAMRITAEFVSDKDTRGRLTRNLEELQSLTESVLSAARAGTGEEMRRIDLAALIESVCADLADLGHAVEVTIDYQAPCVCRPNDIRRAVRNLIENAVRYGGSAQVTLRDDGRDYVIWVDDEGPGIAEERLEEVFEPFVRLEASRNSTTGGTGLGLTLARAVAREHGGDVALSNRPNGGLRAALRLPHNGKT